ADGGTVANAAGVVVQVPPGALSSGTDISIEAATTAPTLTGSMAVGAAFVFGPEGTVFSSPVTVTLPFSTSDLPARSSGTDVHILTAPQGSSEFVSLGGALVDATHVLAETTHFSVFVPAVVIPPAGTDGGTDAGNPTNCGPANCAGCCLTDGGCQN